MKQKIFRVSKIVSSCILMMAMMLLVVVPTFAGTEEATRIYALLSADIPVDGQVVKLPAQNLADAKKWLDENANSISQEQSFTTMAAIKQAQDYVTAQKILKIENANTEQKTQLLAFANQAGDGLGLKVAFNTVSDTIFVTHEDKPDVILSEYKMGSGSGGSSSSSASNGTTAGTTTSRGSSVSSYTNTTNPIKQTGVDITHVLITLGAFSILGVGAVVAGKHFKIFKK